MSTRGWDGVSQADVRRIDTCALARRLWPECDISSQAALLYFLERATARETLREAHTAAADVMITYRLLAHIVPKLKDVTDFERLWRYSEKARVPIYMPFGKWRPKAGEKGTPIADLPLDYLDWILSKADEDMDEHVVKAARQAVAKRRGVFRKGEVEFAGMAPEGMVPDE